MAVSAQEAAVILVQEYDGKSADKRLEKTNFNIYHIIGVIYKLFKENNKSIDIKTLAKNLGNENLDNELKNFLEQNEEILDIHGIKAGDKLSLKGDFKKSLKKRAEEPTQGPGQATEEDRQKKWKELMKGKER